jgi:hypothetical protein
MILLYGGSNAYCTIDIISCVHKGFKQKSTCQSLFASCCTDDMHPKNASQMSEWCSSTTFLSLTSLQPSFSIPCSTNYTHRQRIFIMSNK